VLGDQLVSLFGDSSELTHSERFAGRAEPIIDYVQIGVYWVQVQIIGIMVGVNRSAGPCRQALFGVARQQIREILPQSLADVLAAAHRCDKVLKDAVKAFRPVFCLAKIARVERERNFGVP
jgi:hypothetical protein